MNQKTCAICNQPKELDQFYASAKSRDKRGSYCKRCANEHSRLRMQNSPQARELKKQYNADHQEETRATRRIYQEKKREEIREYGRQFYKAYPIKPMLYEARKRAKKLGIECTITEKDIVIPEYCPVLGIKIIPYQTDNNRDSCPSLDRISLNYGYVPGNVVVVSYRANRIKNEGTASDHRLIADWMDSQARSDPSTVGQHDTPLGYS